MHERKKGIQLFEPEQHVGIKGWHKLTVCDIRHPASKRLQDEIVAYSQSRELPIRRLLARLHALRGEFVAHGYPDTLRIELEAFTAQLLALRDEKHVALSGMYRQLRDLSMVRMVEVPNIIPTAGRSVIARWIIGDNTYSGDDGANYGSVGSGNTAPANGDTQLTTETYRKATSSTARASNIATLSNFYTATEFTGTVEEAGWHIAGSGAANSGQLLSHFLTGTIVKSSVETLTVESELTIS